MNLNDIQSIETVENISFYTDSYSSKLYGIKSGDNGSNAILIERESSPIDLGSITGSTRFDLANGDIFYGKLNNFIELQQPISNGNLLSFELWIQSTGNNCIVDIKNYKLNKVSSDIAIPNGKTAIFIFNKTEEFYINYLIVDNELI